MSSKNYASPQIWQFNWSKWVLYLTIFLVPLYANLSHWYPFTTPKALTIMAGAFISGIFFLWGMIFNRNESFRITPLHYVLLGFIIVMSIAGIFGVNPHLSFFGTFYSSSSLVLLWALASMACLISEFVRRDFGFVRNILVSIFISGIFVSLISYFPLLGSKWRLLEISGQGSTIGNSSFAGSFLLFAIGFGTYVCLEVKSVWKKISVVLGILLILASPIFFNADFWRGALSISDIFHSPMRAVGEAQGALLGIVVAVLATIFLWLAFSRRKILKLLGISLSIIFVLSLAFGYARLLSPTSSIHQSFSELKTGTRFVFWDISARAISERPLLGYGFENFQAVYQKHFDPIIFQEGYAAEQWVTNPHNVIYDMGVSSGVLGLLAYFALFVIAIMGILISIRKDPIKKALVVIPAIFLGYLVQNFFIFDTPTSYLVYFICIGLAMGAWALRAAPEKGSIAPHQSLGAVKIFILAASLVLFVILPARESKSWARLKSMPFGPERLLLENRVQKMSLMGSADDDVVYARDTLNKIYDSLPSAPAEDVKIFLAEIDSLVLILEKDAEKYPDNFYIVYTAGTLVHLALSLEPARGTAYADQALGYFEKAKNISPRNPKVYLSLAQNALFHKDIVSAIALIKTGIELGAGEEGEEFLKRIQK